MNVTLSRDHLKYVPFVRLADLCPSAPASRLLYRRSLGGCILVGVVGCCIIALFSRASATNDELPTTLAERLGVKSFTMLADMSTWWR